MRILLTTEGSYPHHLGDLGNWSQDLITGIPEHRFTVLAISETEHQAILYKRPKNVDKLLTVPFRRSLKALPKSEQATFDRAAAQLLGFLQQDIANLAQGLSRLAQLGQTYDLSAAFEAPSFWRRLQSLLQAHLPYIPPLAELAYCVKWLRSSLLPLFFIPPKTDLVHATNSGLAGLSGWIASSQHGVPLILSEHSIYLRERHLEQVSPFALKTLRSLFFQSLAKLLYFQADRIISPSEFNRDWQRHLKAPFDRTRIIPNGIHVETYSTSYIKSPVVLWIGSIEPLKDLATLLRAFWHVRRVIPDAKLKLFGKVSARYQPYYQQLLELRNMLFLQRAVSFEGPVDTQTALAEGNIFVLSSLSEILPYPLLEAMASQKAIVATRIGGIEDIVGRAGRLVRPREPAALATALIELLSYPEVAERLGKRARTRALEHFGLEHMLDSYANLYAETTHSVHPGRSAILISTDTPTEDPLIILKDRAA